MTASIAALPAFSRGPVWLRAAALFGILWNAFGVFQFANSYTAAGRAAMTAGMTAAQAQAYLSLPAWVGLAFAVGACGGLVGAAALALNRRIALPVLWASFVGYVSLFAADAAHGVFDGTPGQLIVLAFVVAIAAALLGASTLAARRGLLR
jgi:hypothetical protein